MIFWLAVLSLVAAGVAHLSQTELGLRVGLPPEGPIFLGLDPQEVTALAAVLGVLLLFVHVVVSAFRGGGARLLRGGASALVLAGLGFGGYSYRDEISQFAYRIAGELGQPPVTQATEQTVAGERSVKIRRRQDGHFTASVTVNGNSVAMLVDTGASTVVLRQADARKLGVDTNALKFTVPVQTANGVAYAAHVRLRNVMVGPITLAGVDALVAQPGVLKESLLGMTFLSRLRSYEFSGQFLTFRQ